MRYDQSFADYIRKKMGSRSQRQIAFKVGVSQTTIGNYLLGRRPDVSIAPRLAEALGVPENELMVAAGYIKPPANPAERATEALSEIPDMETRVSVFLNGSGDLPDYAKDQIREMAMDAWKKRQEEIKRKDQ
jgi:transcriptional regulator with XRE-family HTH domain